MNNQVEQAKAFHRLHTLNQPLVLINAWDVGSAKAIEDSGAAAIATSSWAVAKACGFEDGEKVPLNLILENASKIRNAVNCPVTLDIETGYSTTPKGVKQTIVKVIEAGMAGINLEDQNLHDARASLYSIDEQVKRIAYAREAAEEISMPLFINARTDVFFKPSEKLDDEKLDEVLARARAYEKAGANGIFMPGLNDQELAKFLCQNSPLPVNLMADSLDKEQLAKYADSGISRLSFGPFPYSHVMSQLMDLGKSLRGN